MKARLPQGHALPQSAKGSRHLAYCAACPNLGDGCRNPGGFYRIGRRSQTGREKRVGARQIQKAFFCKRNAAWHTGVANLWPHPIESPTPGKPAAPAFQHAIRPALHLMQRRNSLNSLGSSGARLQSDLPTCAANPQRALHGKALLPWLSNRVCGTRETWKPRKSGGRHFFEVLRRCIGCNAGSYKKRETEF